MHDVVALSFDILEMCYRCKLSKTNSLGEVFFPALTLRSVDLWDPSHLTYAGTSQSFPDFHLAAQQVPCKQNNDNHEIVNY